MKRYCLLAVLMLLGPSAYAGNSISFVVGGHRVHIEASRHCRSTSCASVSISGVSRSRGRYEDDDRYDDDRVDDTPVKPQPAPPPIAPLPPPASRPLAAPAIVASPSAVYRPAAATTQIVAAPSPPKPVAPAALAVPPAPPSPPALPQVAKPAEPVRPAPQIARASDGAEADAETPIGDWQTESKGSVRIARCGSALCGYVLNPSSNDRGEAILINMKSKNNVKNDTQWSGSVYSQSSADTYYGTMDLRSANTLRVEACALGRFYCSGNDWSRIVDRAESLMSSRQSVAQPRT
jgi:uncharacterized protein (DUF2147 family)